MISRYSTVLLGAFVACLAPTAEAQDQALAKDITFVRNLATKLRFIDLAQAEVERLQRTHKDTDDFTRVSQLGVEISLIGARAHPDREARSALFKECLEKSSEFIDAMAGRDRDSADDARVTLVQACVYYGEFLLEEIEVAQEEAPDRVPELQQRAAEVFRRGVDVCDEFMQANESRKDDDRELESKYYYIWLNKAILQRENARAVEQDREPLCELARETFEDLILSIGEESLLGLRGYFEMSKVSEVLGDYEYAASDYSDTIFGIRDALTSTQIELSQYTRDRLFDLLQEAYDAGANALLKAGNTQEALAFCDQFINDLKELGAAPEGTDPFDIASPSRGHGVFLTQARALAETGDKANVARALEIVQRINNAHPNDFIGIRAKSILKQMMESGGTGTFSGSTLFEVAKGEYQQGNYEAAVAGFKQAYAAMTDEERKADGLELFRSMGRSFGIQKRYTEATLAFARGLELHGDDGGKVEATADNLDKAWNAYHQSTRRDSDPAVRQLQSRVTSLISRFGGKDNAAKLLWKRAANELGRRKYAEAVETLREITPESPYYEPARTQLVSVLQQLDRIDEARQIIKDYEAWLNTKEAEIAPDDNTGAAARRAQTQASMSFYEASLDYRQFNPSDGKKDPTKFPAIITKLENFMDQHGELGDSYLPRAYFYMVDLHCELGEIAKAESKLDTFAKDYPAHQFVAPATVRVFSTQREQVKALETEYEAMVKAGNADNTRKTYQKLQSARRTALALGLDYASADPTPSYPMLANSLNLAEDVEDWPNVEKLATQIIERFGDDEKLKRKVDLFVQPALCESLVRQKELRRAEEMLNTAIEANPENYPLKRLLALALGGWVEIDESLNPIIVPGLDRPDEAYRLMFVEYRKYVAAKFTKYSLDWYRYQWETYWFARNAVDKDSKFQQYHATLYSQAKANEDFATLKSLGPEGDRLFQLFLQFPPRR